MCINTVHICVHERKKVYKCRICDNYASDTKWKMKKHIRTDHTGKKIYRCSICGKYFLKKGLLKKHNADVHEGKKAPMSKKKKSKSKKKKKKKQMLDYVDYLI